MPVTRFASVEAARAEIDRTQHAGHLEAAIGLARLAMTQYPEHTALHEVLSELYTQARQPGLARREHLLAERPIPPRQPPALQAEDATPTVATPHREEPGAARLLAELLAAAPVNLPPAVPPHQRQQLLDAISPLVTKLIQLEADSAASSALPPATRELLRESRQTLRASKSRLEHALLARNHDVPAEHAFVSNLAPPGQTHFTACLSKGPEVLALQQILKRMNIQVALNSAYDVATQKGVYKLQQQMGLKRTGVVDAETRELLNRLAGQQPGQRGNGGTDHA